jgi:NhaP-type Na+/H+ or K+/H+ antiporter
VQCGASEQLKVLIEGESLVNDGSASVVFFLMQVIAPGFCSLHCLASLRLVLLSS